MSVNLTVRTMLLVAAIVALAWAFVYIREALMTLFLALFFALVFEPVVRLMQRHLPMGRGACATTLFSGSSPSASSSSCSCSRPSPGSSGISSTRCRE